METNTIESGNEQPASNQRAHSSFKRLIVVLGAIVFAAMFWHEKLGLNLFLMETILIVPAMFFFKESIRSKGALATIAGTLLAAGAVVVNNSFVSKFAAIASFAAMVGMIQFGSLRSVWHGAKTSIINLFRIPDFLYGLGKYRPKSLGSRSHRFWRITKLSVIPTVILLVFFFIFKAANPVFDEFSRRFLMSIREFLINFYKYLSFGRLMLFLLGLVIINWVLYKGVYNYFVKREQTKSLEIVRKRNRVRNIFNTGPTKDQYKYRFAHIPTLALKNENTMAKITMGLVCLLLIIVNVIDIIFVWFGFEYTPNEDLSARVHEGTYLLILSIVLSMVIMLYFFRKNLNFYSQNKTVRYLSYFWLSQNVVLVTSVIIRNFYYINHQGLTHKRIGVFIFLALTIVGLITLFVKIARKKSIFFLLMNNGWAAYAMLICMALLNWDAVIVRYNIVHENQDGIDYEYLLSLSDEAIVILDESKVLQKRAEAEEEGTPYYHIQEDNDRQQWNDGGLYNQRMLRLLDHRLYEMRNEMTYETDHTFFSWNLRDQRVQDYISERTFGGEQAVPVP